MTTVAATRADTAHRARLADNERWLWRLMLAPAILYIVFLVGFPFFLSLYYSVSDVTVGSRTMNSVPSPRPGLLGSIVPPCNSTSAFVIARPSPIPPYS